uniref:AT-rich interactive domain-containing protein 3 n=1 Tax=Zonotrichia albicollis TaxID=44394 RepID=A0A8D2MKG2_ZONAL
MASPCSGMSGSCQFWGFAPALTSQMSGDVKALGVEAFQRQGQAGKCRQSLLTQPSWGRNQSSLLELCSEPDLVTAINGSGTSWKRAGDGKRGREDCGGERHNTGTQGQGTPGLYELDEDPKRKEFLDDLFGFMQKRGTPVNRIPIMAKQVLDLYTLYQLVTDKGGLVEVINKKIWREITKGLNLPTSITSAAFTLRTQYMKYLYPYECEKRALSSPGELQAAIDSNRREGRRQTFGTALFNYSPASTPTLLGTPKMPLPALTISTHKDGMLAASVPGRIAIPVGLASHHLTAAQAAAASQAVVLEQLREKLETGEPPEKKVALTAEEQQRLGHPVLWSMDAHRDYDRQETALNLSTNSISSINMSIEINGVVYTVPPEAKTRTPGDTQLPGDSRRSSGTAPAQPLEDSPQSSGNSPSHNPESRRHSQGKGGPQPGPRAHPGSGVAVQGAAAALPAPDQLGTRG